MEAPKITMMLTEKVIPYAWNNRSHSQAQIDRIANSISQFGFNSAIVVSEDNVVLVGHGRLEAAKKLGLTHVPVLVKEGLTEPQKKAYRVIDNKMSDDSEWNLTNLELEIKSLQESGFVMEDFGLEEFDFGDGIDAEEEITPPELDDVGASGGGSVIKLRVPGLDLEHFEPELDALLSKYDRITKEKRAK